MKFKVIINILGVYVNQDINESFGEKKLGVYF